MTSFSSTNDAGSSSMYGQKSSRSNCDHDDHLHAFPLKNKSVCRNDTMWLRLQLKKTAGTANMLNVLDPAFILSSLKY